LALTVGRQFLKDGDGRWMNQVVYSGRSEFACDRPNQNRRCWRAPGMRRAGEMSMDECRPLWIRRRSVAFTAPHRTTDWRRSADPFSRKITAGRAISFSVSLHSGAGLTRMGWRDNREVGGGDSRESETAPIPPTRFPSLFQIVAETSSILTGPDFVLA
jgi:hypothetical protein